MKKIPTALVRDPNNRAEVLHELIGWDPLTPEIVMNVVRKVGETDHIEGVVWHHPDGRMAKLKVRDL